MQRIESLEAIKSWRDEHSGRRNVHFVPTMGALHAGHAALLKEAKTSSEVDGGLCVLSIFVNPIQFGPNEDFECYPKTIDADIALAKSSGADMVYIPRAQDIFSSNFSTFVEETNYSQGLCGDYRPGHFRGVTTVVLKLFNLVGCDFAYFGLKDLQQVMVIKKMVQDLSIPVCVIPVETVREPDGLALSSRNQYLGLAEREKAPLLSRALNRIREDILISGIDADSALGTARGALIAAGFRVDYITQGWLPEGLLGQEKGNRPTQYVAVAAHLRSTRLIDNIIF